MGERGRADPAGAHGIVDGGGRDLGAPPSPPSRAAERRQKIRLAILGVVVVVLAFGVALSPQPDLAPQIRIPPFPSFPTPTFTLEGSTTRPTFRGGTVIVEQPRQGPSPSPRPTATVTRTASPSPRACILGVVCPQPGGGRP
jgi:hypothetical protein